MSQVAHREPNSAGRTHAGKTKFINKKTALNFEVVHRSQRDPLAADAEAPQFVLKSIETGQNKKGKDRKVRFQADDGLPSVEELMKRTYLDDFADEVEEYTKEDYELGEYNFPDDGYDYAKHLKEVSHFLRHAFGPQFLTMLSFVNSLAVVAMSMKTYRQERRSAKNLKASP